MEGPHRRLASRTTHKRAYRGGQQPHQENQADRLRVPQHPVLPGPGAALRRKTQLGPVSHRHSPLNSEVPLKPRLQHADYSAWSSSWTTILGTWNQKRLGHSPPGTESDVQNCTPATEVAVKEGSAPRRRRPTCSSLPIATSGRSMATWTAGRETHFSMSVKGSAGTREWSKATAPSWNT